MHHADYIAHHEMAVRVNPNDRYCRQARKTLDALQARRTMRRRFVAVLAVIDVACIALAFATSTGII